jgi:hypothetical protein
MNLRLVRTPPDVDWNDMQKGQIGWSVEPDGDGWRVTRMFGLDAWSDAFVSESGEQSDGPA